MKNNKWIWWTLTTLLTLVVLVGVGAASFRIGFVQGVTAAQNIDGAPAVFTHIREFDGDKGNKTDNSHIQRFDHGRGFDQFNSRRHGGFFPLLNLVHFTLLGLLIWAGYKLFQKSGWKFVKVNAPETPPVVDEEKE